MTDRADEVATKTVDACDHTSIPDVGDAGGGCASCISTALRAYAEEETQAALQEHADTLTADFSERLNEATEEARREERVIAAKESQMRYEDGYTCGANDERALWLERKLGERAKKEER